MTGARSARSLTILVPIWNEEAIVEATVTALRAEASELVTSGEASEVELLVVDDASTDGSGALLAKLAEGDPPLRVIHHDVNRGVGGALRTGFAHAQGERVLYTHVDLPCDLREAATALRLLEREDADVASAYRHPTVAEGPRQLAYSWAWNLLVRRAFDLPVRDVNFPFKAVTRQVLDTLTLRSDGPFIDAELLVRAHGHGFRIVQFPVEYFPRAVGVSTLSSAPDILATLGELLGQSRELRTLGPAGPDARGGSRRGAGRGEVRRVRAARRTPPPVGSPRLLIVNADDYGLTTGISEGILRAHREGVVTSTSVLALGSALARTGPLLREHPRLAVGVHLAAVGEDPPLLEAREVPTLVDRHGRLPRTWRHFLARACRGAIDADDLRRELDAQIVRVEELGVAVTHLDTHQHLHLWPPVREVLLELAARHGIVAVRVPCAAGSRVLAPATAALATRVAQRASEIGVVHPSVSAGLDPSAGADAATLARVLGRLAASHEPTAELWVHPGERRDLERVRYRWGYGWSDALELLTGPAARFVVARHGFVLGTYADLVALEDRG